MGKLPRAGQPCDGDMAAPQGRGGLDGARETRQEAPTTHQQETKESPEPTISSIQGSIATEGHPSAANAGAFKNYYAKRLFL